MQERIEIWLAFWVAKPSAWAIFGIWLALKYAWLGAAWCVNRASEKWAAWRAKRNDADKPVVIDDCPIDVPTKRVKRQAA